MKNNKDFENLLDSILKVLREEPVCHIPNSSKYNQIDLSAQFVAENLFGKNGLELVKFGDFGEINFPYFEMGAITSVDLFGLDELIIFSYYWNSRSRYQKTADLGANIGLHSILMEKCGYEVISYEPDPKTFARLENNISLNTKGSKITPKQKAVSTENGTLEFTRVLGNTTGSHFSGAKSNPYGDLERFEVDTESFTDIMKRVDLLKVDVEGHEATILTNTTKKDWENVDAMVEIGTAENAALVYKHFSNIGVNMFTQKNAWERVSKISDVPTSYKEGSLFLSVMDKMLWG